MHIDELKDKIFCEDCLVGMKQIPDGTIDAVICDLPYGTTHNTWDSVIPFDLLWEQYHRICKPTASILLFGSEPFSTKIRMSNLDEFRYDWIWEKSKMSDFINAKVRPLKKHEVISVFSMKGTGSTIYNPQGVRRVNKVCKNGAGKFGNTARDWNHGDTYVQEFENYPSSILKFDNDTDGFHPTQKPVDLLRYLVLTYTNEGDTVLDNCSGSGTTAVACVKEKRHFICFEKDKNYWQKSVERVRNEQRQLTFF